MLQVDKISAGYGNLHILTEVSILAQEREVTVIVGPNGSGKSTLLKTIAGLTSVYQGDVLLDGKKITGLPPHVIAHKGLSYLPQTESVFTQLTVAENVKMAGYTIPPAEVDGRFQGILKMFPQMEKYMKSKVQNLSGGERQMVAMSMALLRNPSAIMFDEPTANLSPKLATQVLDTVRAVAKDLGLTVLLVEQNAKRALDMGDKAYLLVGGKRVFEGGAKELLSQPELAQMYLGLKAS